MFRRSTISLLCCFFFFPTAAMASAISLGYIQCTKEPYKTNAPKFSISWGQSCAPGYGCSKMTDIRFGPPNQMRTLTTHPKMSPAELKLLNKWYAQQGPRGRGFMNPNNATNNFHNQPRHSPPQPKPTRKYKVTERLCKRGRKTYFRYSFRDWKGRATWIELLPRKGSYHIKVKAAYNKKARTNGWKRGYSCKFRLSRHVPKCKSKHRKRKRR